MEGNKKYEAHIVSHTHWDREWYNTFETFRIRLVHLFNQLLDILESDKNFKCFVFDGQTIILEDFLAIHPEKKDIIKKFVKERRLFIGPFYILPDEYLISGEAHIRNLIIGNRIAREFGHVMKVGYIPDPFGHISQFPQILNGFGIDTFVFMRGLGEEVKEHGIEFLWDGPDGSCVIAVFINYGNAANLGYNPDTKKYGDMERAFLTVSEVIDEWKNSGRTRYILLNNGSDHLFPQPEIPEIINYLNDRFSDVEFIHSNYEDYFEKIKQEKDKLKHYKGELRKAYNQFLLPGVLSTRIYLKQLNERAQNNLEKYTEPLCSFAFLEGKEYEYSLLNNAWKTLLKCHPHDSICGCSIDEVHKDMLPRFRWVDDICEQLKYEALRYLFKKINTEIDLKDKNYIPVVVFNTLTWKRESEPVSLTLRLKKMDEAIEDFVIYDNEKNIYYETQIISDEKTWISQDIGECRKVKLKFIADKIPPCGYKVYFVIPLKKHEKKKYFFRETLLRAGKNFIENKFYIITVNKNGTINIFDKKTDTTYKNIHFFDDVADAGDEYNFSGISKTSRKNRLSILKINPEVQISVKKDVSALIRISGVMNLPAGLKDNRKGRSQMKVKCPIITEITLYPEYDRIDFKTIIENNAKDHRLRVVFPSPIKTDYSFAEGQFDVVKRPVEIPSDKNWISGEKAVGTYPQQNYVSISDGKIGMTVINQGLPEFEAIKNRNGNVSIALTLLRCVGWLSRDDLKNRKWHAGPPCKTTDSQCQGRYEFKYALVLHEGNWEDAKVWKQAYSFNVPVKGYNAEPDKGSLPFKNSFLTVEPDNLILSSLKRGEDDNSLIVRLFNTVDKETEGKITFYRKFKNIHEVNLNEEQINSENISISESSINFEIKPYKIFTLKVYF